MKFKRHTATREDLLKAAIDARGRWWFLTKTLKQNKHYTGEKSLKASQTHLVLFNFLIYLFSIFQQRFVFHRESFCLHFVFKGIFYIKVKPDSTDSSEKWGLVLGSLCASRDRLRIQSLLAVDNQFTYAQGQYR